MSSPQGLKRMEREGLDRATELDDLLKAVQPLIHSFISSADHGAISKPTPITPHENSNGSSCLVRGDPEKLQNIMNFELPDYGNGKAGLFSAIEKVLKYSVNTWDQGFMDKLYAGTNPVGVISELLLAVLNTNVHVFKVSPALSIIEKTTAKTLAKIFGFDGPYAGGISTQGGSASNNTSMVIARNILHPASKKIGNSSSRFVVFTSNHGHYSVEKSALMCGFGIENVWPVPTDKYGCMIPSKLEKLIEHSKAENRVPLYVNATAGTTVLGSFDPFTAISAICKKHGLWLHIDASWGGPVIFSKKYKEKLAGSHLADSLAVNPHKMMGLPLTCSFLLTPDLRKFHTANTLPAAYLFHSDHSGKEIWDLADLTLQCGRRADSLKLALTWIYYGRDGFEEQIDSAFSIAAQFAKKISLNPAFSLVSESPPPCLQVCFYYTGNMGLVTDKHFNDQLTSRIVDALIPKGFLVDYAPGQYGSFLRVVVNRETRMKTIDNLVKAIEELGSEMVVNCGLIK